MTHNETPPRNASAPVRQRIAKLMARVGLCSRRDAEVWIVDGRVSVNGAVLTSPAMDVGPDDRILVDGVPLPAAEKTRLFMFHKPRGLVTSDHDPENRATVADYLREHWPDGPRVVTVGRLDINTEGLLLLTNDGGLARTLELPKTGWARRYRVRAKGETNQVVLDGLRDGVSIDGVDYAGIEATLDRVQGANVWLTMSLREGKNREVKRVLEHVGLEVNRLIRLSFGPFQLGELPEGAVEEVRTRVLRDQLGPTLAEESGVDFGEQAPRVQVSNRGGHQPQSREEQPRQTPRKPREGRRDARSGEHGGDRPLRRLREETPPLRRERPAAGARKHVSALRAAEADASRSGPRRRIERSDVTDRRDRTVAVERLVGRRPAPLEPTRPRSGKRDPNRSDRRETEMTPGRRLASPAAMAKRARVARSGGEHEAADADRRGRAERPPRRDDRPAEGRKPNDPVRRQRHGGDERRNAHPGPMPRRGDADRSGSRDIRAPRPSREARPAQVAARGERPSRAPSRSGAPRAENREARAPRDSLREARPPRAGARDERPDRAAKRSAAHRTEGRQDRAPRNASREARLPGTGAPDERRPTRSNSARHENAGSRRTPSAGRTDQKADKQRSAPRPDRGAAHGKPRPAGGPARPGGGGRPPRGPSRGKPSLRPKR